MSYWNYRVMKNEDEYSIHEVYYNDSDDPDGHTIESVSPAGETLKELKRDMKYFLKALDKPVLIWDEKDQKYYEQ